MELKQLIELWNKEKREEPNFLVWLDKNKHLLPEEE